MLHDGRGQKVPGLETAEEQEADRFQVAGPVGGLCFKPQLVRPSNQPGRSCMRLDQHRHGFCRPAHWQAGMTAGDG